MPNYPFRMYQSSFEGDCKVKYLTRLDMLPKIDSALKFTCRQSQVGKNYKKFPILKLRKGDWVIVCKFENQ